MRAARSVVVVVAFALLPVPAALAVDGVLEINQACVATGCFPNDAPGFPVEVSFGSYRLTSDLLVPDVDTTAIRLIGVGTTLDLNGFQIIGRFVCLMTPPTCPPTAGVAIDGSIAGEYVVRDGHIRDFGGDAVLLTGGRSRVEELTISGIGGSAIVLYDGSIARNNQIRRIGADGIRISAGGGSLEGLIEGNSIRVVGGEGIDAGNALVVGNFVGSAGGESARLGAQAGYRGNRFPSAPVGGLSLGENACGPAVC